MILALLLSALTQQSDALGAPELAKPVSITLRAVNTIAGVQALSKSAGVPMRADASLAHEIIALRLDQAPLNGTMKRLADACGASWALDHGTYILRRTEADDERRKELDHARLLEHIKGIIANAKQELAKLPPFRADRAETIAAAIDRSEKAVGAGAPGAQRMAIDAQALRSELPGERFTKSVLSKLKPEWLATAKPNRRTVFTFDANEMEEPLPVDLTDTVADFRAEQAIWMGAVRSQPSYALRPDPWPAETNLDGSPVKVEVVVNRVYYAHDSVAVQLVDSQGFILLGGSEDGPPADQHWAKLMAGESSLALTGDELAEMQREEDQNSYWGEKSVPLPSTVLERIRRPDRYEPLASYPTTLLFQTAEKRHANLVADMPDELIWLGWDVKRKKSLTATAFLDEVIGLDRDLARFDDDWIVIRGGAYPSSNQLAWRADRPRLAALMTQEGAIGFRADPVARYAFESNLPYPDAISSTWLDCEGVHVSWVDWDSLRIEGALSDAPPGSDSSAVNVRLLNCGPDVLDLLTNATFGSFQFLQFSRTETTGWVRNFGYGIEACDAYPQGLPLTSVLTASVRSNPVAFADGFGRMPCQAATIAGSTASKKHLSALNAGYQGPTTSDRYRMGLSWGLSIQLTLDAHAHLDLGASGAYLAGGESVAFNDLPPDFVKSVNGMTSQLDQYWTIQEKQRRSGGGGATTNGPP